MQALWYKVILGSTLGKLCSTKKYWEELCKLGSTKPCWEVLRASFVEGSLEVKLPTIWTDEKQSRAEAERRERSEERRVKEKE